jgi:acetyltransferase-like isoleucine patch superfamily enzyme
MDEIYKRTLPHTFGKCGRDVCIYYPFDMSGAQFAEIGNNVHISRGAFIRAEGGLCIGDNVHIGRNLVIYTVNHNYTGNALPYDHTVVKKTVVIERNVWIGINVTIVPGVTIGEGAIVGAGSVVAKDIPRLAIVGSAPLRIIKYRDNDHYTGLDEAHRYGGVNGELYIDDG